ncbi:MAG: hypothetical protein NVSMB44_20360 [Ktedonobacteraceae bacterium]
MACFCIAEVLIGVRIVAAGCGPGVAGRNNVPTNPCSYIGFVVTPGPTKLLSILVLAIAVPSVSAMNVTVIEVGFVFVKCETSLLSPSAYTQIKNVSSSFTGCLTRCLTNDVCRRGDSNPYAS